MTCLRLLNKSVRSEPHQLACTHEQCGLLMCFSSTVTTLSRSPKVNKKLLVKLSEEIHQLLTDSK